VPAPRQRSGEGPDPTAGSGRAFTAEQSAAIERRDGDLLLDAGAGSGKTAVLVERFVRAVREDGVEVGQILAITFTDKAASELRDRIRERLRELGDTERARATEGAWISTIHGFCARVLRGSALAAGIDPAFVVLDETEAGRLAELAFEHALDEAATDASAVDLIAGYRVFRLRRAIIAVHDELRSRGQQAPELPPLTPVAGSAVEDARRALGTAHAVAVRELAALPGGGGSVADALGRLERCAAVLAAVDPWLGDIDAARLRNGSAGVLSSEACCRYRDALEAFRSAHARREGARAHRLLDTLLRAYGVRYAELKRERSALDFEDLELLTRDLLAGHRELRGSYAQRFAQIMVDELQDTNPVQLELIESIARENLFTVGDAFQSIYGFRHADVELFERRRESLSAVGRRATLTANFRSRHELLDALNIAFAPTFGERFTPLRAGRVDAAVPPASVDGPGRVDAAGGEGACVELLVVDKAADWGPSVGEPAAAWRLAEARALAGRVHELVRAGAAPRDVVLLARATTDLRAYERALEERGVPTYVIGGRGYWSHPQVVDLVALLRALANPRDGQAFHTVLASPLVGASSDALVVLAAAARESGRDPWWVLREPAALLDDIETGDRVRLEEFAGWFSAGRERVARASIEELLERALELTGYDLTMLAMPGGERRLANVRKLMRLGREHESRHGRDLRGFLDLVGGLSSGRLAEPRESEAPVEGEALDAVRLMTIHRAKGLEFEIVCVADLGRTPRGSGGDLLRVGRDGRLGLKVARAGRGRLIGVLDYDTVGVAREQAEEREERRLYYVAMTRARERLVLSGAITCEPWPEARRGSAPLAWIAPAFVPDVAARAADGEIAGVIERSEGEWRARVAYAIVRPGGEADSDGVPGAPRRARAPAVAPAPTPVPAARRAAPVGSLSYSSLGEYARCGYRFYLERVLGLAESSVRPRRAPRPRGSRQVRGRARSRRPIAECSFTPCSRRSISVVGARPRRRRSWRRRRASRCTRAITMSRTRWRWCGNSSTPICAGGWRRQWTSGARSPSASCSSRAGSSSTASSMCSPSRVGGWSSWTTRASTSREPTQASSWPPNTRSSAWCTRWRRSREAPKRSRSCMSSSSYPSGPSASPTSARTSRRSSGSSRGWRMGYCEESSRSAMVPTERSAAAVRARVACARGRSSSPVASGSTRCSDRRERLDTLF